MLPGRFLYTLILSALTVATAAEDLATPSNHQQPTGTVLVQVTGLRPDEGGGHYLVAIHDSADRWPDIGDALALKKIPVGEQRSLEVRFDDIPLGRDYALQALHDENDNGKLDMRMFVIPKEGFGLSNNYQPREKPKFEKAAVRFTESGQVVDIELAY